MTTLSLAPEVLQWAAGNIGSTVEQLAVRIASESKKSSFIAGKMTPKQAEKFASLTHVPFGHLFLESPPEINRAVLPDLRQVQFADQLSSSFYETVKDIQRKQEWFSEYLDDAEANYPQCVGKYHYSTADTETVAKDIAKSIGCGSDLRKRCTSKEEYFSELVKGVESIGILVFKNGVVHNNGHRPLSVSEFRGFAIAHKKAPVVFVNGRDAAAAWMFTLVHEVAHIFFGASGVSDVSATVHRDLDGLEEKCNKVAAEVLTPKIEFLAAWEQCDSEHLIVLARFFKVSQLVVARRALDFGLISKEDYLRVLQRTRYSEAKNKEDGGGDYYRSVVVRNSKKLTRAVVAEAFSGRMLLRDAGSLLNVSPNSVAELYRRRVGGDVE